MLKKASGLPSCINTAHIPSCEVSVSTMKDLEKSGNAKTGVVVTISFKASNAYVASGV